MMLPDVEAHFVAARDTADPSARAQACAALLAELNRAATWTRTVRDETMRTLHASGMSRPKIAELAGVSVSAVRDVAG